MVIGVPGGSGSAECAQEGLKLLATVGAGLEMVVDERHCRAGVLTREHQLGKAPNALEELLTTDLVQMSGDDLAHDPFDQVDVHVSDLPLSGVAADRSVVG